MPILANIAAGTKKTAATLLSRAIAVTGSSLTRDPTPGRSDSSDGQGVHARTVTSVKPKEKQQ